MFSCQPFCIPLFPSQAFPGIIRCSLSLCPSDSSATKSSQFYLVDVSDFLQSVFLCRSFAPLWVWYLTCLAVSLLAASPVSSFHLLTPDTQVWSWPSVISTSSVAQPSCCLLWPDSPPSCSPQLCVQPLWATSSSLHPPPCTWLAVLLRPSFLVGLCSRPRGCVRIGRERRVFSWETAPLWEQRAYVISLNLQ